ncbi:PEP-CTERM sorting domain-containing protein [Cellvibrio sp. BR]|uniref:PEP-CTERM sorting domain-containing protein n=1 Tax=Cellvibrio sp. BR TaxID=1134474 RepID=UPI00059127A3|nr:PEP-CTERM sorting domain-containing protein [Cellvibrio sp. BR]
MKLIKFAAAALLALSSLSASAGLITVVNNGMTVNPGDFKPDEPVSLVNDFTNNGYVDATSYTIAGSLKANEKLKVTYYYLGQEASWTNLLSVPGDDEAALSVFNKKTITTYVEKDALFDFVFSTPSVGYSASNAQGSTVAGSRIYSFAVALDASFTGQGPGAKAAHAGSYDAILFLDDTGPSKKDDDNHDDLVIGIKVTQVPEPTTLLLMSMGLLGLFGARRLKA